jgi:hypothetical protein
MKSSTARSSEDLLRDPPDVSFILGEPLYQLIRCARMIENNSPCILAVFCGLLIICKGSVR